MIWEVNRNISESEIDFLTLNHFCKWETFNEKWYCLVPFWLSSCEHAQYSTFVFIAVSALKCFSILFPKLLRFGNLARLVLNLNIWLSASFDHFLGLPKILTESRPCRCQYIVTIVCYNLSVIKKRGCLTHCRPMLSFCTPQKDQKTRGFF